MNLHEGSVFGDAERGQRTSHLRAEMAFEDATSLAQAARSNRFWARSVCARKCVDFPEAGGRQCGHAQLERNSSG